MHCHSVRPGEDFTGENLNFSAQFTDDQLLFAALKTDLGRQTLKI